MDGGGIKLAIAILVIFLAMVAFFFAFHPSGVVGADNPTNALAWLIAEFEAQSQEPGTVPESNAGATTPGAPSSGQQSVNLPVAPAGEQT